jgi:hypothetical protein
MVDDDPVDDPAEEPADASESVADPSKRNFMKIAAAAAGAVGAAGVGAYAGIKMQGTPREEFPVATEDDLPPYDQRNMLWTFAMSAKLNREQPERTAKFNGFSFHEKLTKTYMKGPVRTEHGYTQLDRAFWKSGKKMRGG